MRRVTGDELVSEPVLRINSGLRFNPPTGLVADLALHYVSAYDLPLTDPNNILDEREPFPLGNNLLLISRLGYRILAHGNLNLEGGLTLRAPIGRDFREYPGVPMPPTPQRGSKADWGGEVLMRWATFYLKGSF